MELRINTFSVKSPSSSSYALTYSNPLK
ncbi:MAG TPA: hypothetical protein DIC19_03540 [Erysipelotrichaceae bacterium]|nr:hypothetical protein [Erysipelotrichaceae bacterium]